MEKSWNFVKQYDKTTSSQKTTCPTASFLATGGFKFYFKMHALSTSHAVVAAFHTYAQRGEVVP